MLFPIVLIIKSLVGQGWFYYILFSRFCNLDCTKYNLPSSGCSDPIFLHAACSSFYSSVNGFVPISLRLFFSHSAHHSHCMVRLAFSFAPGPENFFFPLPLQGQKSGLLLLADVLVYCRTLVLLTRAVLSAIFFVYFVSRGLRSL